MGHRKCPFDPQRGITGLETAIILIAFVVIASVFAYTVLSTGMFSSQQSQQAVYSGLEEARSTMELRGGVILIGDPTGDGTVNQITFTLSNAMGGVPIDFTQPLDENNDGLADANSRNRVVISYLDKNNRRDNLHFTAIPCGDSNSNHLLEPGEQFQITITDLASALDTPLSTNTQFTIEVKPPKGPVVTMPRTTPPRIERVMNLQ